MEDAVASTVNQQTGDYWFGNSMDSANAFKEMISFLFLSIALKKNSWLFQVRFRGGG